MPAQLGLIPSWVYSADPGVNIKLNPNVTFPPGMTQHTIQPVGSYYGIARIAQPNLGRPLLRAHGGTGCCDGGTAPDICCGGRGLMPGMRGLRGIGDHPGIIAAIGAGLVAVAGISLLASKRKRRRR